MEWVVTVCIVCMVLVIWLAPPLYQALIPGEPLSGPAAAAQAGEQADEAAAKRHALKVSSRLACRA